MGYVLDNCPTLHRCCSSVPLRAAAMGIAGVGLCWAALFVLGFARGRGAALALGVPAAADAVRLGSGVFGVLLCAVHILLFFAAVFESDTLCEVYIWFMIVFWIFLILSAVIIAIAAVVADKILFACIFFVLVLLSVLLSFYFTIVVANYRMTLP